MATQSQTYFGKVKTFMQEFGQNVYEVPPRKYENFGGIITLRNKLNFEEFNETMEAIKNRDFKELIDGICDLMYVVCGMVGHMV